MAGLAAGKMRILPTDDQCLGYFKAVPAIEVDLEIYVRILREAHRCLHIARGGRALHSSFHLLGEAAGLA